MRWLRPAPQSPAAMFGEYEVPSQPTPLIQPADPPDRLQQSAQSSPEHEPWYPNQRPFLQWSHRQLLDAASTAMHGSRLGFFSPPGALQRACSEPSKAELLIPWASQPAFAALV